MTQQIKKSTEYSNHLDIINAIRDQMKKSEERTQITISPVLRYRQIFERSKSVNNVKSQQNNTLLHLPFTNQDQTALSTFGIGNHQGLTLQKINTRNMEIKSSFEYLKSICRSEAFRDDKERIDFLVSEIEILNKRTLIFECEMETLRKENDDLKAQMTKLKENKRGQQVKSRGLFYDREKEMKLEQDLLASKNLVIKLRKEIKEKEVLDKKSLRNEDYVRKVESQLSELSLEMFNAQEYHKSEYNSLKQGYEAMKEKCEKEEMKNIQLNEKLAEAEQEKTALREQIEKQGKIIIEQANCLEKFKKEIINRFASLNKTSK